MKAKFAMMENANLVKSLDGTVKQADAGPNSVSKPQSETPLPLRPRNGFGVSSEDSVPPPGQQLTGKQEHCELGPSVGQSRNTEADIIQISSESSYHSKLSMRSPSLPQRPLCRDSVPRSDPNLEKSPQSTPTSHSFATSLFTMSATSHFWIRRERRNSGKTSFKWWAALDWNTRM